MSYDFSVSVKREETNAEKYTLTKKLFGTDDLIPMWIADMDIDTPDFILEDVAKRLKHPNFGYELFAQSAKETQCEWIQKRHNCSFHADEMFYSPSVVASINAAIEAFTCKGEKIIVQTPVYPPFFKSVNLHEREVLYNPLKQSSDGKYSFDIEDLCAKIDKDAKMLLLCSPHNPVGRVWSKEELLAVAEVAIKHNLVVFSDEIHSDLVYEGYKHTPFASLSEETRQISVSAFGVGKSFNLAGFATSTLIIPNEELRQKFKLVYDKIHFAQGNILGQVAFESAYSKGEVWLQELLVHLQSNIALLREVCLKHEDKISFYEPEGTYLAWLDCKKMGLSDKALRDFFVQEAKVGPSLGIGFSKEGSGFVRLNFAVSSAIMQEAVNRLDFALRGEK